MVDPQEHPKCANQPCQCTPPLGEAYCSSYCREAATSGPPRIETACACKHPECTKG